MFLKWIFIFILFISSANLYAYSTITEFLNEDWSRLQDDFLSVRIHKDNLNNNEKNSEKEINPQLQKQTVNQHPDGFPVWADFLLKNLWGWAPGTIFTNQIRLQHKSSLVECDYKTFRVSLRNTKNKLSLIEKFINECEPEQTKISYLSSLKSLAIEFDKEHHPFIRTVDLKLSTGQKLKGLLGITSFQKKDLIIVRPGIFSSVDRLGAEKFLLMLLLEQLPFHVLYLESTTSSNYLMNNNQIEISGLFEGMQNLEIARRIKNNKKFTRIIDKIHLIGFSLGGNGVLLAHQFSDEFASATLFCPVIQFEKTFNQKSEMGLKNWIVDLWTQDRFQAVMIKKDVFEWTEDSFFQKIKNTLSLRPTILKQFIEKSAMAYKNNFNNSKENINSHYIDTTTFQKTGDFYNDLRTITEFKNLKNSFTVIATEIDELVSTKDNYDFLKEKSSEENLFLKLKYGQHCSISSSYDWNFTLSLLSGILLSKIKSPLSVTDVKPISDYKIQVIQIQNITSENIELKVYFDEYATHKKFEQIVNLKLSQLPWSFDVKTLANEIIKQSFLTDNSEHKAFKQMILRFLSSQSYITKVNDQFQLLLLPNE